MLGKNKKTESGKPISPDSSVETKSATLRSRSSAGAEKTVIGEHISIEGTIRGEENLEIEGSMRGNIELEKHNFKVGPTGQVEGEIKARNVSVSGEFKGNIQSNEKVLVTREADFYGEIKSKSISIEDGAYIKGVIELDREPNRKPTGSQKPDAAAAPQTGKASDTTPPADKKET
ncbi:MAG: polymer-forming cytoskeletal protein [Desulfobacterales bacterium]|jgi:cytoskeletal protein CcmA (bactofilin family)